MDMNEKVEKIISGLWITGLNSKSKHKYQKETEQGVRKHKRFRQYPASSVGRGSDYESKGFEFESHCGQEFYILYFFFFSLSTRSPQVDWAHTYESSMTFIHGTCNRCIERKIIWKKNGGGTSAVPSTRKRTRLNKQ